VETARWCERRGKAVDGAPWLDFLAQGLKRREIGERL